MKWSRGGLLIRCSLDNMTLVSSTASFVSFVPELLNSGWDMTKRGGLVFNTYRQIDNRQVKVRAIFMEMYHLPGQDNQGVRIEFNPNFIAITEVVRRISFLTMQNSFRLSRLDVAFDLVDEYNLHDYVIDLPRVKRNTHSSSSGKLETLYLGAPSSEKRLRVYDKRCERIAAGYSEFQLASSWWRVEAQLRSDSARNWQNSLPAMIPTFTRFDELGERNRLIAYGVMSGFDMSFVSTKKLRTWRSIICSAQTDLRDILISTFNDNVHQIDVQINTVLANFDFESVQLSK